MGLPWVRLDSNIFTHDKILWLLSQRDGYRAYAAYTFSLAYAGGHGTDGDIPDHALPVIHANARTCSLLEQASLWTRAADGYRIHNWDQRQELAVITEAKRASSRLGGRKRSCVRYHGPECGCWRDPDAEILPMKRTSNA